MELHPILEQLLDQRGLHGQDREVFLDPSLRRLGRAEDLPGIPEAAAFILPFIADRRPIVVFGDYDCDRICACTILVTALRRLGGRAEAFFPDRFDHGYGMTEASIAQMLADHPDVALVVTVDNGICSRSEVAALKARGVAVVVTDHHIPPDDLPESDALVNPRVASAAGFDDICGAGVAFLLANALARLAAARGVHDGVKFGAPLLVLAGLATVSDLMPLVGQNRILVKNALAHFAAAPVGLRELYSRNARRAGAPRSRDFGFQIGPRINAAGRIANARQAYELLMESDRERARNLAQGMDALNLERKAIETGLEQAARAVAVRGPDSVVCAVAPASASSGPDRRTGVMGIVAARLVEEYGVPVAVLVGVNGSARAPDGYNVHDMLQICSEEALVRFGGHAAAGGFTVREGRMDDFRRLFAAASSAQRAVGGCASGRSVFLEPDVWLKSADVTLELARAVAQLEPFGEGNPEPVFGVRALKLADVRLLGREGAHLKFEFAESLPSAVWWGHGGDVESFRTNGGQIDAVFRIAVSDYGGEEHPELTIASVRPAEVVPA